MIEDPPLLTIRRKFTRPSRKQVDAFAGAQTGHVVDALGGRAALPGTIRSMVPGADSFCGIAVTCHAGPADNLAVFAAIDAARPGDVIVAATDAFTATAVVGDLVLGMARNKGVAGFVTDGCVRDTAGIAAVGLPCFAAGVTPDSPARNGPGTVGLPVQVGGHPVEAGDIVVADADGVVIVPRRKAAEALARLDDIRTAEAQLEARVNDGLTVPDFVEELLKGPHVRKID